MYSNTSLLSYQVQVSSAAALGLLMHRQDAERSHSQRPVHALWSSWNAGMPYLTASEVLPKDLSTQSHAEVKLSEFCAGPVQDAGNGIQPRHCDSVLPHHSRQQGWADQGSPRSLPAILPRRRRSQRRHLQCLGEYILTLLIHLL